MKIKDIVTEQQIASGLPGSWYDKFRQKRGEISQLAATKKQLASPSPTQEPNQEPAVAQEPEAAIQQPSATMPAQQPERKAKLAPGVTIVDTEPVIIQVGKKLYYIMDDGLWHEQGNRNPVDATWNSFLNNQMDLALLGQPSVPPTGEKMSVQPEQPIQTRQQKQAAAAAAARSQMGIK